MDTDPETCPMSDVHQSKDFGSIFRESYHTWLAGAASGRIIRNYTDSDIYRFLIPLSEDPHLLSFSRTILSGLEGYEDTIASYIRNGGDILASSIDLKVHANTVRYRLARIKELTGDPDQTDHQLFRDLFIAYSVREINK
jgi:DNA-binding PucR family transcriptional regulator